MARKTNYAFERNTRAKAKAEKREAKRQARLAKKEEAGPTDGIEEESDLAQAPEETPPPAETP